MADPCVVDTASIHLDTTGTPAVLEASVRNPSSTYSATMGADDKFDVTDTGVQHDAPKDTTGPHPWPQVIDNTAGSLPLVGIAVLAINPIWVAAVDPISIVAFGRITFDGVVMDERDMEATGIDMLAGSSTLVSLGCLLAQISVPAGSTKEIDAFVWIKNIGASGDWSFRFGGSEMIVTESF
jgi:hypothetical protein